MKIPANDNARGLLAWWLALSPADKKSIVLALIVYGALCILWLVFRH